MDSSPPDPSGAQAVPPPRPPMSTTSLPDGEPEERPPASRVAPPVLASAILLEDVAPLRPAHRMLRAGLASIALVFGAAAALSVAQVTPSGGAVGAAATASLAAVFAFARIPYAARASLAITLALVPLALGAVGDGPLAVDEPVLRALSMLPVATALPAVMLFRARYRALGRARHLIAAGLVAAAPGVVTAVLGALDPAASVQARIVDGVVAACALGATFGFMGEETTGGAGVLAFLLANAVALRFGGRAWRSTATLDVRAVVAFLGAAAASLTAALGGMQLLAVWLAPEARKVDVHRPAGERAL